MKFKMNDIPHIANGVKNQIKSKLNLTSKEQEELFAKRKEICDSCKYKIVGSNRCGECGCPLDRLQKSEKHSCPNFYW